MRSWFSKILRHGLSDGRFGTSFTYSPTRRWLTRVQTTNGATVLEYARDLIGRITAITGLSATESWTFLRQGRRPPVIFATAAPT